MGLCHTAPILSRETEVALLSVYPRSQVFHCKVEGGKMKLFQSLGTIIKHL